jgi:hypothetical protein
LQQTDNFGNHFTTSGTILPLFGVAPRGQVCFSSASACFVAHAASSVGAAR